MATKPNGNKKAAAPSNDEQAQLPIPDFQDVDAAAVEAAANAMQGGFTAPLTPPTDADVKTTDKGVTYTRWAESIVIKQAYRNVTRRGLLDVTVQAKVRQSEENEGANVWFHFYQNVSVPADQLEEGQVKMNQRSIGAISSLLKATGFMPTSGALKAAILTKMFPSKGQPGTASPLVGKTAIANIVQQEGPKKDKNGKVEKDDEGKVVMERRDNADSFLPEE